MELLIFIFLFLFFVLTAASPSLRLDLLHRHHVNTTLGSLTRPERLRELIRSDLHRHVSIAAQVSNCNGSIIGAPMTAGRDLGIGQYLVEVSVGSPPQKFRLIADTGSELTWMRCKYKNDGVGSGGDVSSVGMVTFETEKSSTFRTVACSSRMCKVDLMNLFSLTKCPTASSPCAYDYRYSDGSEALGIFAYETVTVEFTNKLHHKGSESAKIALDQVLVGCSQTLIGQTFQVADGVLGLAYSNQSFTSKTGQAFGATFSYCLVDHLSHINLSSYLTFGRTTTGSHMRYTKLELNALSPFYAVNILGISVGGTLLRIPSNVWAPAGGGGTIIDSGTSLTFLTQPAYELVVGALDVELRRYRRLGSDFGPLDYCFNATEGFDDSLVPRLVIHFTDGARFEPPVKSYVIDAAPGVKCLGLLSVSWPGVSVIGNILQQNHLWSFNLADQKLGFAPSSCI